MRTDDERMHKLFDMNEKFYIRYLVKRKEDDYRATVVHGDEIGKQRGIFSYESFLETFDTPFRRNADGSYEPFPQDIEFAIKGLNGGLSSKILPKVLKVYGSDYCKNKDYVKRLMKTEDIRVVEKRIREEKSVYYAR